MSLLNPSVTQINKYSFLIKDTTTDMTYADAGVDLTTVTAATLTIKKAYLPDNDSTVTLDILNNWAYMLTDGITINVDDLPNNLYNGYAYFPDWMYSFTVTYTYNGTSYTKTRIIGFAKIIRNVVMQQLQQADWVNELKCSCGCEKLSLTQRKFNYLKLLTIASEECLIVQYQEILLALYKLAGQTHEYSD